MLLLVLIGACVLLTLGVMVFLLLVLQKALNPAPAVPAVVVVKPSFWQRYSGLRPLSQEHELVMEHTYDGIVELNNPTPPWFMALFYGTITFGIGYMLIFHVFGTGDVMGQEYGQEMAIADRQREAYIKLVAGKINENNVTALVDVKAIGAGKALFTTYCVACHGAAGQGGVGPNLTDEFWLHGGLVKNIFHTLTEGVPEKGMISWKKQLNPLQIQQMSSFILTLKGTNPPGAKAPQGEKLALN